MGVSVVSFVEFYWWTKGMWTTIVSSEHNKVLDTIEAVGLMADSGTIRSLIIQQSGTKEENNRSSEQWTWGELEQWSQWSVCVHIRIKYKVMSSSP